MAPEMVRCELYGASADIFSFAILLWELATLKIAFQKYKTFEAIELKVVDGQERPSTRSIPNTTLQNLLKGCWSDSAEKRPPMAWVLIKLKEVVEELAAQQQPPARRAFMSKERSAHRFLPQRPKVERQPKADLGVSCPNLNC
jgi:hypothetical protein